MNARTVTHLWRSTYFCVSSFDIICPSAFHCSTQDTDGFTSAHWLTPDVTCQWKTEAAKVMLARDPELVNAVDFQVR
jgi:hypothetical protein